MRLNLCLVGFGTVGQGFARILMEREEYLRQNEGVECRVVAISDLKYGLVYSPEGLALDRALKIAAEAGDFSREFPASPYDTTEKLLRKGDYDLLVELTVTNLETGEPALGFIRTALERGKDVITTNKGPIALNLENLESLSRKSGAQMFYEGTVLSGTPLINLALNNLAGSGIMAVEGILNGTCNYILTEMQAGSTYQSALKKAQELGYAEANPEADVEGWDALAKLMILSRVIFRYSIKKEQIVRRGITGITSQDIQEARANGKVWKLIASLRKEGEQIIAAVKPEKIPIDHPLASVNGPTNALTFTTEYLGQVTIIGPGAGRMETGFAVFSDLIALIRKREGKR